MRKLLLGLIGLLFAVPAVATTLPAGYTELEYIESTGTQWIDTGIVPNSNSVYRMTTTLNFQSIPSGEKWFATATGTGAALGRFQFCGVYNKRFVYGYGSDWNYASQTLNTNTDYPIDVTLSNGNQNFNGTSSTYSTQTGSFESSLYLFAFNPGSGVPTYAISVKASVVDIYQDDVLIFNGVPVRRNSDNVVGMYDTVSGNFFTNAGTGEFTGGDPVVPTCNLYTTENSTSAWINETGGATSTSYYICTDFIQINPNTTYSVYAKLITSPGSSHGVRIGLYDANKTFISPRYGGTAAVAGDYIYNFTTPSNARYIRVSSGNTGVVSQVIITPGTYTTSNIPTNMSSCHSNRCHAYTSATGTVTQNGTPTPTNPIEPVFYQQGNMILRKVGDIADSYDATTGIITRRVGEYIVKGTEAWSNYTAGTRRYWFDITTKEPTASSTSVLCNKYHVVSHNGDSSDNWILNSNSQSIIMKDSRYETPEDWKAYLADQYAAGTPVIIYYPLKEAKYTTEYVGTEWCEGIKIATTAYNSARFSPVVTELNDTIATIRDVVTNTINQTKAIADLQATKQTRPDETCPAGKKCLLVEDNAGQPHWYEIIENAD